jgi:cytochrome c-type biogenesis protein CcmH/NrfG/cytochrome c553
LRRRLAVLGALTVLASAACGEPGGRPGPAGDAPTFALDVAPILHAECAVCHHDGGAGPFPLLTYADARERARQIADVTARRYMPPWLPEPLPGPVHFEDTRRLTDDQIATLAAWAEAGAPEGDPARAPEPPRFAEGWHLGEPDVVVESAAFSLPADGPDRFRNFVLPVDVPATRYVEAVELAPGDPRTVHHAVLQVDRSDSSRRLDDADPGPGFGGMFMGGSERPDGHFVGWTPGHVPRPSPEGLAWRLEPGSDLVLQLHMPPTGKPETVTTRVGLHFTDEPPTRQVFGLLLGREDLDIPAGATDYMVEDRFTLPAAVRALSIYPHAHYLGRRMEVWAELPASGAGQEGRRDLLTIPDWDFNWQDEYRYAEPLLLPAGAEVVMRYTYDNSVANPRNPHGPPRRVTFGPESTDEMAFLLLSVLPVDPADLPRLQEAQLVKVLSKKASEGGEGADRWRAWVSLGDLRLARRDVAGALGGYRRAAELEPEESLVHQRIGRALGMSGRMPEALAELRRAVELDPDSATAHADLAMASMMAGRAADAEAGFRRALELDPDHAEALVNYGMFLARAGRGEEARGVWERALAVLPEEGDLARQVRAALARG